MLEMKCIGDKFELLVAEFHTENHQHNEQKCVHKNYTINIFGHYHKSV